MWASTWLSSCFSIDFTSYKTLTAEIPGAAGSSLLTKEKNVLRSCSGWILRLVFRRVVKRRGKSLQYIGPLLERLGTVLSASCGYSDCFLGRQWTRVLVERGRQ